MAPKTGTIEQKVFIPATPEEVYDALIDEKKHSTFTGSEAKCDAKVGGEFSAWEGYISGRNLVLEKGKKIVQEWKTTEWPKGYPPSILEFTFKKKGAGTELTMVQSKVPSEQIGSYDPGWHENYWEPMKEYFTKRGKTK